jgi:hypothetical protein
MAVYIERNDADGDIEIDIDKGFIVIKWGNHRLVLDKRDARTMAKVIDGMTMDIVGKNK